MLLTGMTRDSGTVSCAVLKCGRQRGTVTSRANSFPSEVSSSSCRDLTRLRLGARGESRWYGQQGPPSTCSYGFARSAPAAWLRRHCRHRFLTRRPTCYPPPPSMATRLVNRWLLRSHLRVMDTSWRSSRLTTSRRRPRHSRRRLCK